MNKVIKIYPNGEIKTLYDDFLPAMNLGKMELTRLSNVVWNKDKQKWVVTNNKKQISPFFRKRSEAIDWEINFFNKKLMRGT